MQLEFGGLLFIKAAGSVGEQTWKAQLKCVYVCVWGSEVLMTYSSSQRHCNAPSIFRRCCVHSELTAFLNPRLLLWNSSILTVELKLLDSSNIVTQIVGFCCVLKPQRFVDLVAVLTGNQTLVSRVWRGQEFCFSSQKPMPMAFTPMAQRQFFFHEINHTRGKKSWTSIT